MFHILPFRGLRYYRIGIKSPIFLEKSIVSVSYQYRNSWTGKYRISISIDFSRWKVSVSVSVSPFSKMSIKSSITPNYTLFWILKCNKNGYFNYLLKKKQLFLEKNGTKAGIISLLSIANSIGIEFQSFIVSVPKL